ncbi:MAG: universal stress protein [Bacteroidota bacterium]
MDIFKRILVGIDLTQMDETLLKFTSMLVDNFEVDTVYFIHVAKSLEIPEGLSKQYPGLLAPTDETIENQINGLLETHFEDKSKVSTQIIVREGNAEEKILRWSGIKEVDLMILGRKRTLKGSGLLVSKLTRAGHCSTILIPEFCEASIKKVMIPVDFSTNSEIAFREGMTIKKALDAEVILQHTYRVPIGYNASGKSYEEFRTIMETHAVEDARKFLARLGSNSDDVKIAVTEDDNDEPADKIYEEANVRNVDLMVISSRGRTGIASLLLGSVAEKLSQYNANIPLLIVRDKGESMGFLEALWRI